MNWLITGGCGFLGTALISRLTVDRKNKIRVVDNLSVGNIDDLIRVCGDKDISNIREYNDFDNTKVQLVQGDILDAELALRAASGADVIVHLAANTGVAPSVERPREDMQTNVIGTFNYLEAARSNKCPRFVFASSGAPVGEVAPPIHEELPPHPVSPYGASKLAGEGYCSAYHKTFGMDTIILRFGNVYGPGSHNKNSVIAKFIRQAIRKDTLKIHGDGLQTRDFIYIDDLIDAVVLAASIPGLGGEVFQIASNRETTISEMAETLLQKLQSVGLTDIPLVNAEKRLGDVMRNYSDTTKAMQKLGWRARVELDEGLQKTIDYFLA